MATPLTCGSVALIREFLRKQRSIASPSAALLKATLIAGAVRLPGLASAATLCDNHQGYGRVNLDAVLAPAAPAKATFVEVAPGLVTGAVHTQTVNVASSSAPLRVVLAYTDFPGPAIVNNLNLVLTAPNGTTRARRQSASRRPHARLKKQCRSRARFESRHGDMANSGCCVQCSERPAGIPRWSCWPQLRTVFRG